MQAIAAAVLAAACTVGLKIDTHAGSPVRIALGPRAAFSVLYHHSMYDAPFTEDFVIDADAQIHVVRLSSPSAAVLEYHGIYEPGGAYAMDRLLGVVELRIAMKDPQELIVGKQRWSFREFGAPGDRLILSSSNRCP